MAIRNMSLHGGLPCFSIHDVIELRIADGHDTAAANKRHWSSPTKDW